MNFQPFFMTSICTVLLAGTADLPLRTGQTPPQLLDLRTVDPATLIALDGRNPQQVEAANRAWLPLLENLRGAGGIRLRLPAGAHRVPLLLAASQAIKGQNPGCRLYVAFDPKGGAILDEIAWGAVEGGALGPEDLGPDPGLWRELLVQAQEQFPGRPWTLWAPVDPGARLAMLLGDGCRMVVPDGPGARLARSLPAAFTDVEGGLGDLTLLNPQTGEARRWKFDGGEWRAAERHRERNEVQVVAQGAYNVGELLARMRGAQFRDRVAIRTATATLDYGMHFQGERGNSDLGFVLQTFEKAGEPEEGLRKKVTFNGVTAKIHGDVQLPIVEARTSLATPVALALTERYRYSDAGPAGPGQRLIHFQSVDADPLMYEGDLKVDEVSGRIQEERSQRSGLPGIVRSEQRVLSYGAPAPGLWRVVKVRSTERWMTAGGMTQVLRTLEYRDFGINEPGFEAARNAARASDASMVQQTLDGARYYRKQKDGTRKAEDKPRSSGRALVGLVLANANADMPVLPLAALLFFDFNAFNRGVQYMVLTAGVFNNVSLTVPNVAAGVDFHAGATLSALAGTERPAKDGHLQDRDGVQRRSQRVALGLARDLGAGLRLALDGTFRLDQFADPKDDRYHTPGFVNPASGWNRFAQAKLSWQYKGFQVLSNYGVGQRPDGLWGAPGQLQEVPEQGRYRRWGGAVAYDVELRKGMWLQATLGHTTGRNFDRFQALEFAGLVSGIKPNAVVADRMTYQALRLTVPTGANFRLNLGLNHGEARSLDDQKTYGFTGLQVAGDLPGFGWFTSVRVDLGVGLQSDMAGVRTVNGMISFVRLF